MDSFNLMYIANEFVKSSEHCLSFLESLMHIDGTIVKA